MFFKKNKERLSVELLEMEADTSEMINIKDSRVVYINGAEKLKIFCSEIRLNNTPLVQINAPYCPTINSLLSWLWNRKCKMSGTYGNTERN